MGCDRGRSLRRGWRGCGGAPRTSTAATADEIPTTRVKRGDLDMKVYVTGELRASHSEMLTAPPIGGGALQITHLLHTGTAVKKGDLVMEFDPSEQHYKLDQNRSELLQAEQEITKAKADAAVVAAQDKVALLKARFDVRRAELDVQKNELVSSIDARKNDLALEQAKRVLAELEQDVKSRSASNQATISLAEEKRNKAKLAMDQAQDNIDKMRVTAPMDGLVALEKNEGAMGGFCCFGGMSLPEYREGDQVEPGRTVGQVHRSQRNGTDREGGRTRAQQHQRRTVGRHSARCLARQHVSWHGEDGGRQATPADSWTTTPPASSKLPSNCRSRTRGCARD